MKRAASPARTRLALALALALACAACGRARPERAILISIDTLRADHLSCYGHPRPTSPNLDAFAAEGILFEDAMATSPWTLPSHASLLTGLYPAHNGVRSERNALAWDVPTLAQVLARNGFETMGVVNSPYVDSRFGFHRGFEVFERVQVDNSAHGAAREISDRAMRWLEARSGRRVFLFLHYFDVHSDYRSQPQYERLFVRGESRFDGSTGQLVAVRAGYDTPDASDSVHLEQLYDAGIRQLDEELARLLSWLRSNGWLERSIVVFTSDHGEEFLDHGGVLHGHTQYQELLRIPLLLRGPSLPAGTRVAHPVSLVDVAPTILSLLGIPDPPELDGEELQRFWQTPADAVVDRVLFAQGNRENMHPDTQFAARRGRHKLLVDARTGERELYDLVTDPGERDDLAEARPERASELERELKRLLQSGRQGPRPPRPTDKLVDELRALGYVDDPGGEE